MKEILITIWLLLGIIGVWRTYWGAIKEWHIRFNEDIRNTEYGHHKILIIFSPILIVGGLLTLMIFETIYDNCWYFKTKL